MNSNILVFRKRFGLVFLLGLTLLLTNCQSEQNSRILTDNNGQTVSKATIYADTSEKSIVFAVKDLEATLINMGASVSRKSIEDLSEPIKGVYFVVCENNDFIHTRLSAAGAMELDSLGEQEYSLRIGGDHKSSGFWAIGGDRIGAMYGGIHIGEIVAGGSLKKFKNEDQTPYIAKRGLKVNIPLDSRTPSFDDGGVAANTNRDDVWDISFWEEYLDVLARQRYNVISLWVRHPFPSLVNVPGYEDISLQGVMDDEDNLINNLSIEEKIVFWNQVLDLADDRGIEVWPVVWNVELQAADGKYGITREKGNEPAKDYLRKAVKQMFISYPKLAGIGVTAGEKMNNYTDSEKEQWVWDTYGMGVLDAKELFPDRKIRFVHRHWLTDWKEIESRFSALPDGFELALKYAQARLYSATNPSWATKQLSGIPKDLATWWNLRNDDIYVQRWGDAEYVKEYMLTFPHKSKPCDQSPCLTAGYVMGSDRYFWGRESMSKNPQTPRQLENEKHWYSFLLWGRLGYDPNTPKDLLKGLIQYKFPTVDAELLQNAWHATSKVIPTVNRFHYWNWDYFWWVERGTGNEWSDINGYHTINHVIENATMDVSGYTNIKDFVAGNDSAISPLQVANELEQNGTNALNGIAGMKGGKNIELTETLNDIRSQAHFGLYWAHKIRGGVELELYRTNKKTVHKENAIAHLENALLEWKQYAANLDASYEKVNFAGHHVFDWDALTLDVANDIKIAQEEK